MQRLAEEFFHGLRFSNCSPSSDGTLDYWFE